jgi:hypothetical protein
MFCSDEEVESVKIAIQKMQPSLEPLSLGGRITAALLIIQTVMLALPRDTADKISGQIEQLFRVDQTEVRSVSLTCTKLPAAQNDFFQHYDSRERCAATG